MAGMTKSTRLAAVTLRILLAMVCFTLPLVFTPVPASAQCATGSEGPCCDNVGANGARLGCDGFQPTEAAASEADADRRVLQIAAVSVVVLAAGLYVRRNTGHSARGSQRT